MLVTPVKFELSNFFQVLCAHFYDLGSNDSNKQGTSRDLGCLSQMLFSLVCVCVCLNMCVCVGVCINPVFSTPAARL